MGYSVERRSFNCWRCGFHPTLETLTRLLHVDRGTAIDIWRSLGAEPAQTRVQPDDKQTQRRVDLSRYRRPSDVGPLRPHHHRYLERRGFDPDEIERQWGVLGSGPVARLDGIDYRHRLVIPIRWEGAEVSFQARDVTGRSERKYVACPADREITPHKTILYGDQAAWGGTGIIVEGVTDVWRLGPLACATFGIKFTMEQVRAISRAFRRVAIVFDPEPQAQRQARRLEARLRLQMREEPVVYSLGDGVDPGALAPDDAAHLVRELTR